MKMLLGLITALTMLTGLQAHAGIAGYNGTSNLNIFQGIRCPAGGSLTCSKATGLRGFMDIQLSTAPTAVAQLSRYSAWVPGAVTQATSKTGSITVVYLTQINILRAATLTGIQVLNAATVGTNKWAVALFNSSGVRVANSATAGVTTAGASALQAIPFTATYTAAPGTYWIGLYVNGTTDTYYAVPAVGALAGLAGSVTGQTFGTFANVALPTTFTADLGPVASTY